MDSPLPPKRLVVSIRHPPKPDVPPVVEESQRAAAARWGAEYVVVTDRRDPRAHFDKLCLDQLLEKHGPCRVVYLDYDIVVREDCPNFFELVPPGTFGTTRHRQEEYDWTDWLQEKTKAKLDVAAPAIWKERLRDFEARDRWINSGILVFDLPRHVELFKEFRLVAEWWFEDRNWPYGDEGVISLVIHASKGDLFDFLVLPPCFNATSRNRKKRTWPDMWDWTWHFAGVSREHIGEVRWKRPNDKRHYGKVERWNGFGPRGLTYGPELPHLLRDVCRSKRVVEVGTYLGGTAIKMGMCLAENDGILFCVDPFVGISSEATHQCWKRNIRDRWLEHTCHLLRMPSLAAAEIFADWSLDMVYIDGDHSRESCWADIQAWLPKVRLGGILCGHDYNQKLFPGVVGAVEDAFGAERWGYKKYTVVGSGEGPIWRHVVE